MKAILVLLVFLLSQCMAICPPQTEAARFCRGESYAGGQSGLVIETSPCPAGSMYQLYFSYQGTSHVMVVTDWQSVIEVKSRSDVSLYLVQVVTDDTAISGIHPDVGPWNLGFIMPTQGTDTATQPLENCPVIPVGPAVTEGREGDWNPYLLRSGNNQLLRPEPKAGLDVSWIYPRVVVGSTVQVISEEQFTEGIVVFQQVELSSGLSGYLAVCNTQAGEVYLRPG